MATACRDTLEYGSYPLCWEEAYRAAYEQAFGELESCSGAIGPPPPHQPKPSHGECVHSKQIAPGPSGARAIEAAFSSTIRYARFCPSRPSWLAKCVCRFSRLCAARPGGPATLGLAVQVRRPRSNRSFCYKHPKMASHTPSPLARRARRCKRWSSRSGFDQLSRRSNHVCVPEARRRSVRAGIFLKAMPILPGRLANKSHRNPRARGVRRVSDCAGEQSWGACGGEQRRAVRCVLMRAVH